jgi:hypothetical protein
LLWAARTCNSESRSSLTVTPADSSMHVPLRRAGRSQRVRGWRGEPVVGTHPSSEGLHGAMRHRTLRGRDARGAAVTARRQAALSPCSKKGSRTRRHTCASCARSSRSVQRCCPARRGSVLAGRARAAHCARGGGCGAADGERAATRGSPHRRQKAPRSRARGCRVRRARALGELLGGSRKSFLVFSRATPLVGVEGSSALACHPVRNPFSSRHI